MRGSCPSVMMCGHFAWPTFQLYFFFHFSVFRTLYLKFCKTQLVATFVCVLNLYKIESVKRCVLRVVRYVIIIVRGACANKLHFSTSTYSERFTISCTQAGHLTGAFLVSHATTLSTLPKQKKNTQPKVLSTLLQISGNTDIFL